MRKPSIVATFIAPLALSVIFTPSAEAQQKDDWQKAASPNPRRSDISCQNPDLVARQAHWVCVNRCKSTNNTGDFCWEAWSDAMYKCLDQGAPADKIYYRKTEYFYYTDKRCGAKDWAQTVNTAEGWGETWQKGVTPPTGDPQKTAELPKKDENLPPPPENSGEPKATWGEGKNPGATSDEPKKDDANRTDDKKPEEKKTGDKPATGGADQGKPGPSTPKSPDSGPGKTGGDGKPLKSTDARLERAEKSPLAKKVVPTGHVTPKGVAYGGHPELATHGLAERTPSAPVAKTTSGHTLGAGGFGFSVGF
jgi:hypothetical protein